MDTVPSNISNKQASMTTVPSNSSNKRTPMDTVPSSISNTGASMDTVSSNISNKKAPMNTVASSISNTGASMDTVSSNISNKRAPMDTAPSKISNKRAPMNTVPSNISNTGASIDTMSSNISTKRAAVDTVPSKISNKKAPMNTVPSMISNTGASMVTLSSNLPNEKFAEAAVPSSVPKEKRTVYIQVNFIKVGEINTLKETFDAEVMVKSRWREPTLDGQAEDDVDMETQWNPKIYIENAVGDPQIKTVLGTEQNAQRETFLVERKKFRGSFIELMELWDFPFDVQELSILIKSDTSINETELVDETEEMHKIHKRSFMDEQEFYLYKHIESSIPPLSVDQELGIIKSKKPSLKVSIYAARLPHYFIWNMFLLMSVIVVLSFTSFGIDVQFLPNRLQLCFVLVLAAVTFKSVVNAHIPKISYFTYLDTYVLTMTILLASISCWHGLMTRVEQTYKAGVDRTGLICFASFYFLFHVSFSLWVLSKPYSKRRDMQRKEIAYQGKYSEALKARIQNRKSQPNVVV